MHVAEGQDVQEKEEEEAGRTSFLGLRAQGQGQQFGQGSGIR